MPRRRTSTAVATALLLVTALTGCGQDSAGKGSGMTTDSTVTTGPSDVTEMESLVDAAESAAAAAESAATDDEQN
ncbi:hypothetical protein [Streptomyces sp. NPDC001820]|uniref:hypothetical protein n=1 Tax=Streptomyces sp. NPDC001820 TaxID=3364613 RepID=UPI00367C82A6